MKNAVRENCAGNDGPATIARLRAAIDRGQTGDKVDAPDPAVAGLGTDDEAAGAPIPTEEADKVLARETATAPVRRGPSLFPLVFASILIGAATALLLAVTWLR